jgi:hypothetical protein
VPFRNVQADPALMDAMRAAFATVCAELDLSCGPEDRATDLVVSKIVAIATGGVTDSEELAQKVLEEIRGSDQYEI